MHFPRTLLEAGELPDGLDFAPQAPLKPPLGSALRALGIDHRPRKGGQGRSALDVLPWSHSVFGKLKTWLRGTFHGVRPKHLQRTLDELAFRFNRRWKETELFIRSLDRAIDTVPCPYHRLTAERIE